MNPYLGTFVVTTRDRTFRIHGQVLTVYLRAPVLHHLSVEEYTNAHFIHLKVPASTATFLKVWSYLNAYPASSMKPAANINRWVVIYRLLLAFGLTSESTVIRKWKVSLFVDVGLTWCRPSAAVRSVIIDVVRDLNGQGLDQMHIITFSAKRATIPHHLKRARGYDVGTIGFSYRCTTRQEHYLHTDRGVRGVHRS